jgi:hypothetical protein
MAESVINRKALEEAAINQMLGNCHAGFCKACGEERDGCEPDARNYECYACGEMQVFGAELLFFEGE